jgi:hypothetical protein
MAEPHQKPSHDQRRSRERIMSSSWKQRLESLVSKGKERAEQGLAVGKSAVDDRMRDRRRNELLRDLGSVYYRSVEAGVGAEPDPAEIHGIIDALKALDADEDDTEG